MPVYPSENPLQGARLAHVAEGSPFDDGGFTAGCTIHAVDGQPVRDLIDWRWLSAGEDIVIDCTDADGDRSTVSLWREPGEAWGVEFDGFVFDGVRTCCNACSFCFMRQLPEGLRPSLSLRDDDFRLSFLLGTFVTLTNLASQDEERIIAQRISPLRFSLHAYDARVREALIGRHAAAGLEAFERLQEAGIRFDAQIVLVPGVNDGAVLDETLAWAARQPGLQAVGIVPLGYTRYQSEFTRSFDEPEQARAVLAQVERAQALRDEPWVFAADEFYLNAFGKQVLEHLPKADFYGSFEMFEDGIGMVRAFADDWRSARESGLMAQFAQGLETARCSVRYVAGEAMQPLLDTLVADSPLAGRFGALTVGNAFFGGNVTVTGLLAASDIAAAARNARIAGIGAADASDKVVLAIPRVIFNDDGLTLDGRTAACIAREAGVPAYVVSCNISQIIAELRDALNL